MSERIKRLIETAKTSTSPVARTAALESLEKYIETIEKENLRWVKKAMRKEDNPPLKFEDIKAGSWVWDNKLKKYIKISDIIVGVFGYAIVDTVTGHDCYYRFEDNRFYRREVV